MVYCFYTQGVRMRVVGVIAEYNPLHNGHIYHLERAKTLSGADYCIVVLSGSFVQRGEAACMDKYTRAGWAVKAGADLVLELPSVYAVASAERFALGGIRTLLGTGVAALESPVPRSELIEFKLDNDQLRIDGNMAIAWSSSLNFTVEKSTRSLIGSAVSGEGLVNVYRGTGTVLMAPVV